MGFCFLHVYNNQHRAAFNALGGRSDENSRGGCRFDQRREAKRETRCAKKKTNSPGEELSVRRNLDVQLEADDRLPSIIIAIIASDLGVVWTAIVRVGTDTAAAADPTPVVLTSEGSPRAYVPPRR